MPRLHLVRHAEVENPDGVVYADLAGFPLSGLGRDQARQVAGHLADLSVSAVVASPLDRALETAEPIAAGHDLELIVDDRLTEWSIVMRWGGVVWDDIPDRFPGEQEAFLDHPWAMPLEGESLEEVAARVAACAEEWQGRSSVGEAVLVTHQDPLRAAVLQLMGRSLTEQRLDMPGHGEVVSLEPGEPWRVVDRWTPEVEAEPFPMG